MSSRDKDVNIPNIEPTFRSGNTPIPNDDGKAPHTAPTKDDSTKDDNGGRNSSSAPSSKDGDQAAGGSGTSSSPSSTGTPTDSDSAEDTLSIGNIQEDDEEINRIVRDATHKSEVIFHLMKWWRKGYFGRQRAHLLHAKANDKGLGLPQELKQLLKPSNTYGYSIQRTANGEEKLFKNGKEYIKDDDLERNLDDVIAEYANDHDGQQPSKKQIQQVMGQRYEFRKGHLDNLLKGYTPRVVRVDTVEDAEDVPRPPVASGPTILPLTTRGGSGQAQAGGLIPFDSLFGAVGGFPGGGFTYAPKVVHHTHTTINHGTINQNNGPAQPAQPSEGLATKEDVQMLSRQMKEIQKTGQETSGQLETVIKTVRKGPRPTVGDTPLRRRGGGTTPVSAADPKKLFGVDSPSESTAETPLRSTALGYKADNEYLSKLFCSMSEKNDDWVATQEELEDKTFEFPPTIRTGDLNLVGSLLRDSITPGIKGVGNRIITTDCGKQLMSCVYFDINENDNNFEPSDEMHSGMKALGMTDFWTAEVRVGDTDPVIMMVASTDSSRAQHLLGALIAMLGELDQLREVLIQSSSAEYAETMHVDQKLFESFIESKNAKRGCLAHFKNIRFRRRQCDSIAKYAGYLTFEECEFEDKGVCFAQGGRFCAVKLSLCFSRNVISFDYLAQGLELGYINHVKLSGLKLTHEEKAELLDMCIKAGKKGWDVCRAEDVAILGEDDKARTSQLLDEPLQKKLVLLQKKLVLEDNVSGPDGILAYNACLEACRGATDNPDVATSFASKEAPPSKDLCGASSTLGFAKSFPSKVAPPPMKGLDGEHGGDSPPSLEKGLQEIPRGTEATKPVANTRNAPRLHEHHSEDGTVYGWVYGHWIPQRRLVSGETKYCNYCAKMMLKRIGPGDNVQEVAYCINHQGPIAFEGKIPFPSI